MDNCAFCPIEKKTKWYRETEQAVVCEKLGGGKMVVLKRHTTDPTEEELEHCHAVVEDEFGEHEFVVLMGIVKDHWHAHIRKL